MVKAADGLYEAGQRLVAGSGGRTGRAGISPVEIVFVPWRDGTAYSGADQWGFSWFKTDVSFEDINTSGLYQIENYTDSYLILGEQAAYPEGLPSLYQGVTVGPFTAGIYGLKRAAFSVTCVCAGYDFTTARPVPGANAAFLGTRSASARVRIVSLAEGQTPGTLPPLRGGWQRVYDWYDLTAAPHSSQSVAHGAFWNSPHCDFTGAKSVTANVVVNNAAGVSFTVIIYSTSPTQSNVFYPLVSTTVSAAGNNSISISGTPVGVGPYIQVLNNDATNAISVSDANLEVAF